MKQKESDVFVKNKKKEMKNAVEDLKDDTDERRKLNVFMVL
jgi:hypothetical protein